MKIDDSRVRDEAPSEQERHARRNIAQLQHLLVIRAQQLALRGNDIAIENDFCYIRAEQGSSYTRKEIWS